MRWPRRDTLIPLALAALAFVLAFAQRPGLEVADTKVDLHVDPGSFLGDVLSAWTPSGSLGHVWAGQYGGYLFPMGPFFALGHALGLPDWLVQRLWLGAVLALARGAWCGCSTRSAGARAAPATWPAGCSTCSTRTSSPTRTARRSRCWPRRAAVAAAVRAPRAARPARAGAGRRRSRSC